MNVLSSIIILFLLCFSNWVSVFPQSQNGFDFVFEPCYYKTVSWDFEYWGLRLTEMASSQIEIVSSSPFGCVLRDHNRSRDRCSSNAKTDFQKNFKELVNSCITSDNSHDSWLPEIKVVKKSKIVDRWARARQMVFPVDDNNNKAENLILTTTHNSNFPREISPSQSDDSSSIEIRNSGGVSSLVRKWRHFEADSKNLNAGNNGGVNCSSPVSTMSNSGSTLTENPSFVDANDSVDGKSVMSEELFFDWESERTTPNNNPSSRGRDSDAAERERIRVADIVKKLTSDTNDREPIVGIESLARIQTAINQQTQGDQQQRIFPPVIGSPRLIRGRQAYSNFLIQMERDKTRELQGLAERKPVSKFSHRGRIQALLRIRFLRRESEAKSHRRQISKTLDSNRHNIKHLRERFSAAIEHGRVAESHKKEAIKENTPNVENSSSTNGSGSSTQAKDMADKIPHPKNNPLPPKRQTKESQPGCDSASRPSRVVEVEDTTIRDHKNCSSAPHFTPPLKEDTHCKDTSMSAQQKTDQLQNNIETNNQESKKAIQDGMREGNQELADTITKENEKIEERVTNAQKQEQELAVGSEHDWVKQISHAQSIWEGEDPSTMQLLENCQDWISEFSQPRSEWEQESNNEQPNTDWIYDIARPRSDWEGLRQARYQEMLDPYSNNREIRQLLERRSVSSFLSSGLRDRIDQLMISRTGQAYPMDIQVKAQEQEQEDEQEGSVRVREVSEEEEEEEEAMEVEGEEEHIDDEQQPKEEEEEARNEIGERECNEYEEEFNDQNTSPMQLNSSPSSQSWSRGGDREVSDDFDQFASPSFQQSLSSSSYSRNNQQSPSPFMNHSSIEMEFIYDLRGHMEQLHQEISDLRKSMKSCVSMQVKLQRSIKQEVAAAVSQSVRREGNESVSPKKRSCLVCRKMKVDSFLYRCGHMCTCFKCAHELQWGSGKCPICQSPILDVVRTHDR